MKRFTYPLLAFIIVFITATFPAVAQKEEGRQVSGFNSIASDGPFEVHIKIDGTESLKISSSSDIIELIETRVEDGILKIKFKDHLEDGQGNSESPIKIYVTAKLLSAIAKTGSGSIRVDGALTGKNVTMILNGSGDLQSSVKSENLKVTVNGSVSILLKGTADKAMVEISGPAGMNARDLQTKDVSVIVNGSGNARFNADKTLSARIVGSGNVVYSGNATVVDSKTVGSGTVSKAN